MCPQFCIIFFCIKPPIWQLNKLQGWKWFEPQSPKGSSTAAGNLRGESLDDLKDPSCIVSFSSLISCFWTPTTSRVSKHVMLSVLATQTQELWIFACGRMRGSKVWKWFFTLWSCDSLCEHEAKWHVQLCIHFTLTRLGFCLFLIHWSSHKVHSYFSSFHWQGTRWSGEYVKWQDINIVSSQFSHMNGFFCPYLFLFRPKKSRRLQGW